MFSANENLMLREYKKRVVGYIESKIPEDALDMGTTVMVMETVCKTPGCVPLETSVIIVFPKDGKEHIEGLPESCGGTFKTKILLPLRDVTEDDVLDALPPSFKGKHLLHELVGFVLIFTERSTFIYFTESSYIASFRLFLFPTRWQENYGKPVLVRKGFPTR